MVEKCPRRGCDGVIEYDESDKTVCYAMCKQCGKRIKVHSKIVEESKSPGVSIDDTKRIVLVLILVLVSVLICIIGVPIYREVQYEIGIEKQLKDAQELVTAKKYMDAIEIYGSVPEQSRHFEEANELIQSTKEGYRDYVIQSSSEFLSTSQYEAAYTVLQQGKEDLGNIEELVRQEKVVQEKINSAVTPSVKIEYKGEDIVEGDVLDPALFTIELDYLGLYQIECNAERCEPQMIENVGETEIQLSYEKSIYSWVVNVIPKVQKITAEYIGSELTRGDTIKTVDFKVIGICTDSSTRELEDFQLSNTVLETYGNNLITVSYGDLSCECYVKAKPQKTGIQLSTKHSQYERGKTIGEGELVVELVYEDGSKESIDSELCTYEGRTPKKVGSNILEAKYDGFTATTEVTGIEYVSLKKFEILSETSGGYWKNESMSDIMGNVYEDPLKINVASMNNSYYAEWYLGGRYEMLEGTIATFKDASDKDKYVVSIYADNRLVYTSQVCSRRVDPFSFSVSIENTNYLKIATQLVEDSGHPSSDTDAILSDLVLVMTK